MDECSCSGRGTAGLQHSRAESLTPVAPIEALHGARYARLSSLMVATASRYVRYSL